MFGISLCAAVFDPAGDIRLDLKHGSELAAATRRVSRTATLDGAAVLEDNGYTASDATFTIKVRLRTIADEDRILRLVRLYPLLTLATRYGCYLGAVDDFRPDHAGGAAIRFLVQRQLSQ